MRTRVALGVAAVALLLPRCFLLTGGTSGYQLVDAGTCSGDSACPGIALGCVSSSDCNEEGGTDVCCATVSPPSSARSACQKGPCDTLQLCKENKECVDETCVSQECAFGGAPFALRSCGGSPVLCSGD